MPTAGSATVTAAEARPARLAEAAAQHVIDEADHRADDFRRRVVRAGQLAQVVVVDRQEVLVEVEPGVGLALADRVPVHGVEHARQRAERGLQRRLVVGVVGQQAQGGADERVGLAELLGRPGRARRPDGCRWRGP